jgi:hypothetical protein
MLKPRTLGSWSPTWSARTSGSLDQPASVSPTKPTFRKAPDRAAPGCDDDVAAALAAVDDLTARDRLSKRAVTSRSRAVRESTALC